MTVFWGVAPCSLTEFTDVSEVLASSIIALMMEAAITSETSVNPDDSHLHTRRRKNLKSHP
jgi:hypothetical protein